MTQTPRFDAPLPLLLTAVLLSFVAVVAGSFLADPFESAGLTSEDLTPALRFALWVALAAWAGTGLTRRPPMRWLIPVSLGLGLGTALMGVLLAWVATTAFSLELPPGPEETGLVRIVLVPVALVLGPLGEEWLFRGSLFAILRRRRGPAVAIVGSALAFGLFHLHPIQSVVAAAAGLALGWLREHGGRLWPCVLAHAAHNGVWLLVGLL
jgi:membrane protease YdiL (CAAX protease family)